MRRININLPNNLVNGTLIWIDASNHKVYYSSKRYDVVEFTEHDSNYLGEFTDVFSENEQDKKSILKVLEGVDRIFGIYLLEADDKQINKEMINAEVVLFTKWEELKEFSADYFEKYDQLESEKKEEKKRREQAKKEWLERGRRFIKDK